MLLVRNFKNINWEHVEFDEGKSQFLLFLVVCHILSEKEDLTFPYGFFPRIVQRYSTEINTTERKNWIV